MNSNLFEKGYEPHNVEKRWYDYWEKEGLFEADENKTQIPYSIVIPPPNVTGVLHMGHALNITMQDILCRYKRLCGYNVLWMPGTDHAGIATQNVVERELNAKGITRDQLGRKKFIDAVWKWRKEYGGAIINQLKRLGASCDWKRERFTMDEGLSAAVRKVFVTLYKEGLIYRGDYIINWCPRCNTALSDLEVEHKETDGYLYHIKYPYPDGSGALVVATTRPETMFGDTGVAINPDDERYQSIETDKIILPLAGRLIPIIKDKYVDMSFGTGVLKITPAHDSNDFEIGMRHNLPVLKVIDNNGIMMSAAGKFEGQERFECRENVLKSLKEKGLLVKTEPYTHGVGHCYRCKTVVEPNLSKQWFVSAKPLAEKAIKAVKTKQTRIIPEIWTKTYFDWMNNIKDWCISRQIWWGHQIPAWTCDKCNELVVEISAPEKCTSCGASSFIQDPDVLDTWFSSALWPFSTMGWPDDTQLLKKFYPTSVLITGFDILFFWVARMMMMGIHMMDDIPFNDVYIHALVRDENGKKMSKSKGNVIDPLTVIEAYGTDAFRFTLAAFAAQGRDIKMSEKRVEGYRHFINKLWNASRFAMMHIVEEDSKQTFDSLTPENLSLPDKWILSRLHTVAKEVANALDSYRFNDAATTLYQFVWHEFCDWYLEAIKPILYSDGKTNRKNSTIFVLKHLLKTTLILLHPFIPFVTEEIWHKIPGTDGSIMKAVFPVNKNDFGNISYDSDSELKMEIIIKFVTGIRTIRGEMNIQPSLTLDALIQTRDQNLQKIIKEHRDIIINLARLKSLSIQTDADRPSASATTVVDGAIIFIPLKGIIDFEKEIMRLEKEITKINKELLAVLNKLNNEEFLSKAPAHVVEKVKEKQEKLHEKQQKTEANLDKIKMVIN